MIIKPQHLLLGSFGLFCLGGSAQADTVRHFNAGAAPGQFPLVSTLLDQAGIGASNVASETTANSFTVPGAAGGTNDLTFTFLADGGAFLFTFGYYDMAAVSANPLTDKQSYAVQALSSATVVFDDRLVDPVASTTLSVPSGANLGFFLIPNNTVGNFLANPGAFYTAQTTNDALRAPLFSVSDANPGQFDQFLSFVGTDRTLFTWEDLTRANLGSFPSDNSFADMAFQVNAPLIPNPVIPEPGTGALVATGLLPLFGRAARRRPA